MKRYFVGWVCSSAVFSLTFGYPLWKTIAQTLLTLDWGSLSSKSNPSFFSRSREIWYIYIHVCIYEEYACTVLDMILIYRVLHVKDMSFDKQDASAVTHQQHKTPHGFTTTSFCDHSGVLLSRSHLLQNKQVHVFSARHLIPQVVGVIGSSRYVGHHSFNQIYRHGVMGIYWKTCACMVFPIRMVGASTKVLSASQEIRKFFHTVCFDLIVVGAGVFQQ